MFKGYRTLFASFLTILFGVLASIDWNTFFHDPKAGGVAIVIGIIMAMCRVVTTTPIFESKHPAEVKVEEVEKVVEEKEKPKV